MLHASEAKAGQVIKLEERLYKILEVNRHAGSGQMQGFVGLKLKDIRFGHVSEKHFKHGDKLEEIGLVKRQMDFLYADPEQCYFMDPVSFEQIGISKEKIGEQEKFLIEGMKILVELFEQEPVTVNIPKVVELKISMTGPGTKGGQDSTMKTATLENGIEILVPQFIETGETVRVDTEKIKYIDRVTLKRI